MSNVIIVSIWCDCDLDIHREFHELGLLETAKNKKKQHENQFIELKSSSESIKVTE